MITAAQLAARICPQADNEMTTYKLQKLLYYCQAWSLGRTGKAVFNDEIRAFRNGPVVGSVFELHRGHHWVRVGTFHQEVKMMTDPDVEVVIAETIDFYGDLTANQLVQLTHAESPWIDANAQGEHSVITQQAMARFYANKTFDEAVHDCFVRTAGNIAAQKSELLALLAG